MTIQFKHAPRTMTRDTWRTFYRALRQAGAVSRDDDELEARAILADELRAATVDGKIVIVVSGMDCDCVQYVHSHEHDAKGVAWFLKLERENYEWADGPMAVGFCRPDERPENYQRDLAMEAYEDGRPHLISAAL